jgi:hypothetical protein
MNQHKAIRESTLSGWGDMTRRKSVVLGMAGLLVVSGSLGALFLEGNAANAAAPAVAVACHPGPSADCVAANLAGANLSHLNLSNADFTYADLSGADLNSANLTGADLGHADLGDADLSRANLKRTTLTGVNFMGADLSGATNSTLDSASASSSQYVVCHTILPSGRRPANDC